MPKLKDVMLMNGLKANLINISQLCDDNLFVQFTKESCLVTNNSNLCVMKEKRPPDNCYLLAFSMTCYTTLIKNSDIWHRRLGHISPRRRNETITTYIVLGIPKMKVNPRKICGSCQFGKQVRITHKVTQHVTTTRILELLHMDLMEPMQVESPRGGGGREGMLLCVLTTFLDIHGYTFLGKNQTPLMHLKHYF